MKLWLEGQWANWLLKLQNFAEAQFFALLILAAVLVLLLILSLRRQPKHIVAYKTDEGEVWVTRSAIIELIKTTCEQLPSVQKPAVKMRTKRGLTHFNIAFKLASNGQLKLIESALQTQLRQALLENFGLQNLGKINLIATGFKHEKVDFPSAIDQANTAKILVNATAETAPQDSSEPVDK